MPCPTCSATLECLGVLEDSPVFLCPRCGTVTSHGSVYVPKLVERCRQFARIGLLTENAKRSWHCFGLGESIDLPEDRKLLIENQAERRDDLCEEP